MHTIKICSRKVLYSNFKNALKKKKTSRTSQGRFKDKLRVF